MLTVDRMRVFPRSVYWSDRVVALSAAMYIALLYFRPLVTFFFQGSGAEYASFVVLGSLALTVAMRSAPSVMRIARTSMPLLLLFFIVLVMAGLFGDSTLLAVAKMAYQVAGAWLTFVLTAVVMELRGGVRWIVIAIVSCAAINAGVGVWGAATGQTLFDVTAETVGVGAFGFDRTTGRSGGIAGENYVGVYDVPALLAGMHLLAARRHRLVGLALVVVAGIGIAVSLSRTSIVTAAAGVFLTGIVALKRRGARTSVMVGACVAAVLAYAIVTNGPAADLSDAALEVIRGRWSARGFAEDGRIAEWRFYLGEALSSPVLGRGPGYIDDRVARGLLVPHNSVLDIAVELGGLGLAVYLAAFTPLTALLYRLLFRREDGPATTWFVVCFWTMATSLITLSNPFLRIIWLVGGAAYGVARASRSEMGAASVLARRPGAA